MSKLKASVRSNDEQMARKRARSSSSHKSLEETLDTKSGTQTLMLQIIEYLTKICT